MMSFGRETGRGSVFFFFKAFLGVRAGRRLREESFEGRVVTGDLFLDIPDLGRRFLIGSWRTGKKNPTDAEMRSMRCF